MEKIVSLVNADLLILLLPCLSFMLYEFIGEGMIFEKYGKWIATLPEFIGKPLGLCLKCFHVWVVILFSLFIGISLLKFIILLSVSYVILVKLFYK